MIIGPFHLEVWHLVLLILFALFLGWMLWGFLTPVTGTWERVDEDVAPGRVERITLVQFGPFVRGRRMMKGGFQEYNGLLRGRSLAMTRADHGHQMITNQGFPPEVAKEIDGSVTARLTLTLSADRTVIHGTFAPQKIEFTYTPPKVTRRLFLEPSFRRYKLISRKPLETEVVEDNPADDKGPLRRTV